MTERVDVDRRRRPRARRRSSPCRRTGPGSNIVPRSATAITEIALPRPSDVSVVPSIGSTAMSVSGGVAVADLLAVVEHRRLVLLALADDDDAVHRHGVEHEAHGVDGGAVGALLVAAAHPAGGGQRGGLGDPDELQGEVAIGGLRLLHGQLFSGHRCWRADCTLATAMATGSTSWRRALRGVGAARDADVRDDVGRPGRAGVRARRRRVPGRVPVHPRARTRRCTARSSGRCGCSPASAPPTTPTRASTSCSRAGGDGLSTAFDLPTLMGRDSDDPLARGRGRQVRRRRRHARRHGGPLRRHRPRRRSPRR